MAGDVSPVAMFPQAYMENFGKCAKTQKQETVHCPMLPVVGCRSPLWPIYHTIWFKTSIGEFFQGGFFSLEVVTFFVTLRADLEDYFKCKT